MYAKQIRETLKSFDDFSTHKKRAIVVGLAILAMPALALHDRTRDYLGNETTELTSSFRVAKDRDEILVRNGPQNPAINVGDHCSICRDDIRVERASNRILQFE